MKTIVKKINETLLTIKDLEEAVSILQKDGLVAFPTETVYGLGANALHPDASKKIYAAKGRPSDNPLIIHIADMDDLYKLADEVTESALLLAKVFWPGPLTLILKKSEIVPYSTTGGLDTVAIRMPKNQIALSLIKESGLYIAAPSANVSGRPSPTKAEHVIEDLDGIIDMIIDGGKSVIGLESTIVDVTGSVPVILRPGYITKDMISEVVGHVEYDSYILKREAGQNVVAKAPGMKYKHYAPKGELTIYEGSQEAVIAAINKEANEKIRKGYKVGIIGTDETLKGYPKGVVKTIGTRADEETIASGLFELLREFDKEEVEFIYSESFQDDRLGQAIMNRLLKAAGYHIETV